MKRLFRGCPVLRWLALVVAVVAVLGHVCVLPHEAYAIVAEPSESHDSRDSHDEDSQHDALHAASCEAVPSSATPTASVLPVAGFIAGIFAEPARREIDARQPPPIATAPPLFLLHASFLI